MYKFDFKYHPNTVKCSVYVLYIYIYIGIWKYYIPKCIYMCDGNVFVTSRTQKYFSWCTAKNILIFTYKLQKGFLWPQKTFVCVYITYIYIYECVFIKGREWTPFIHIHTYIHNFSVAECSKYLKHALLFKHIPFT